MRILVTGGAGFVGTHLAEAMARKGHAVTVLDNLSRRGAERNLQRLQAACGDRVQFVKGDVRDAGLVRRTVDGHDVVFHFAAQVAVTTSVEDPRTDFEINAAGTFNVLEAARLSPTPPILAFSSTNKVYGVLPDLHFAEGASRYDPVENPHGVDEHCPLDFHSPYGCSKGTADQYVRDYARIYGLRTVLFRMSCIYGPWQFGTEDQGWVAHFVISWLMKRPITIYGNGKQVRDILFAADLVRAFEGAVQHIDQTAGQVFNIGGGPQNAISLLELVEFLRVRCGYDIPIAYADWRPGDQVYYVSDLRKARRAFGWEPQVSKEEGLTRLLDWAREHMPLLAR